MLLFSLHRIDTYYIAMLLCIVFVCMCVYHLKRACALCARSTLVQCHRKKKNRKFYHLMLGCPFSRTEKKQVVECIVKNLLFD